MKKPSHSLFQLVSSLTKEEKIYFKKYAASNIQGGDKVYIKLFDRMSNMKKYDEGLLKETFSGEKFTRHFWKTKNYLYNTILKSLRDYHSEKIMELKTNEVYNNLHLLLKKNLHSQCKKLLIKAKKMCYDYELFTSLLNLLNFEKKLMTHTRFSGLIEKDIQKHFDEINETTTKIKNLNDYQYNSSRLFLLIKKKGSIKCLDDMKDLNKIMEQPIYKDINNALTFETKLSFYKAHYYYDYLSINFESCLRNSEKMLELFESSNIKMKSRPDAYLKLLNNHLEMCLLTSRFEAFINYFKKFRVVLANSEKNIKTMNIISLNLELEYYIKSGKYETGIKFINQIIPSLDIIKGEANEMRKCSLYYNIAYLYFLKNDYSHSLRYLNKIINNKYVKEEIEVFFYARLLNLIIHYELGNLVLLEYILKSTYRYLYKKNRVFKFEKQVYYFIRSLFTLQSDEELKYSFQELKQKLEEISSDPFERGALGYIDLISWLESKITNRQFSDVVKDKLITVMQNEKEVTSHQAKLPL